MSDFANELFLRLACETPLPHRSTASCTTNKTFTAKPYTCAQAKAENQAGKPPVPLLATLIPSKKRTRKPEFDVFVDADAANTPPIPSPKKFKSNGRVSLSIRTDSANLTPAPSPRLSDTPFPFSSSDPLWANVENYDTCPVYLTPPSTPRGPSPGSTPSPHPPPYHANRAAQSRSTHSANQLPTPKDNILYSILKLEDWQVTQKEIKVAYKKIAMNKHPDKVAAGQREDATHTMQAVNAAKEVLLDSERRRAYHKSGKLPWTT